ncbi:MAG: hypothetical protein WKF36_02900 [Candidatus Nitrosocosmicus sp.]
MAFAIVTSTKGMPLLAFLAISTASLFICFGYNASNSFFVSAFAQGNDASYATVSRSLPSAQSIHATESLELPPNIGAFVMLIANEAHESWVEEPHKLITDKNAYHIPTNLIIYEGTELAFLNADAPWDTPHPHTIEFVKIDGNQTNGDEADVVYSTGVLDYTFSSKPVTLPVGRYSIVDTEYESKGGIVTVLENNNQSSGSSNQVIGGFYTPTNQVENNKDNDGNSHPGSLAYYTQAFNENGIDILSEHNFTYSACDYCPGGYWPDNKSEDHTLIIFSSERPLEQVLGILERLVKDNVYV